jgi:hypothetical protein
MIDLEDDPNDPGSEADAIGWIWDEGDFDGDEHESVLLQEAHQKLYDDARIATLAQGKHTTREGEKVRIEKMGDRHLKNSINFGSRNMKSPYWSKVVPMFKVEARKRGLKWR